jgi:hypothetical protein
MFRNILPSRENIPTILTTKFLSISLVAFFKILFESESETIALVTQKEKKCNPDFIKPSLPGTQVQILLTGSYL